MKDYTGRYVYGKIGSDLVKGKAGNGATEIHLGRISQHRPLSKVRIRVGGRRLKGFGKDPFEEVWTEVEQWLKQTPYVSAKSLFERLQQKYPGKFTDGQLRIFQRRINSWRTEYVSNQLNDSPEMDTIRN